ncbi:MotA/TolQ/ExbB proton channel family protein [Hymenobacter sp. BT730]|uniref:MotA/TolQ/ExbB proton channel family protein n=1 Tax=Hymenobacter sp. BT730 TaxID=3063332 RepID=UPI0026DF7AC6|nr:MotA/TolQ/ExbB proton channel family protein [Hymenobacter sp. BT730]
MLEIILELVVVLVVVGLQIREFLLTRSRARRLELLYPERIALRVERRLVTPDGRDMPDYAADAPADSYVADLIKADPATEDFRDILLDTNEYLRHNKGAAADFDILKDISERRSEVLTNEVQSGVATPLYLGLLGTFLGVILGLVGIARNGVSDENALTPFLTGVLIAMAGSFVGLLLTLLGNGLVRRARKVVDERQNQYYTFLQVKLLPILHSDMAGSLTNLKAVLDAFNQDFVGKVTLFEPILNTITENIRVQRDFLVKLEEIGYDRMAQANLEVFDKVRESAEMFGQFTGYQQKLNQMLAEGTNTAHSVAGILDRLRGFERGINDLGQYIGQNDNLIQHQLDFFQRHQKEMDALRSRTEQYFDQASMSLTDLMQKRLQYHERDAQQAYEKWGEYFQRINQDNVFERIMRQLDPLKNVDASQQALSRDVTATQRELLRKVELDSQIQAKLLAELSNLNTVLVKATAKNRFQRFMDKLFGGVQPQ